MPEQAEINELIQLRHQLHRQPELSGSEMRTSKKIRQFISAYNPDQMIDRVGGCGLLAVWNSGLPGPKVCFRADMDALPIDEPNTFAYKSEYTNVSHKCGHDGHMVMVAGLAGRLKQRPSFIGKLILLFQPAEETGEGAERMLKDDQLRQLQPDLIIGLHNLPKKPKGTVLCRTGVFAAASRGVVITLTGATSHAAEPENGNNPALAVSDLLRLITELPQKQTFADFVLTTVVHTRLGEIAFGTSPGYAEIRATLRSFLDRDMEILTTSLENMAQNTAKTYGLKHSLSYTEVFPATENGGREAGLLQKVCERAGIPYQTLPQPFRWSEDFGHFKHCAPTLFFGLGAGNIPDLHNQDYDFPDDLIPTGLQVYEKLWLDLQDSYAKT